MQAAGVIKCGSPDTAGASDVRSGYPDHQSIEWRYTFTGPEYDPPDRRGFRPGGHCALPTNRRRRRLLARASRVQVGSSRLMGASADSARADAERRRFEAAVAAHAWEHRGADSDAFRVVEVALIASQDVTRTLLRVRWMSFGESFSQDVLLYTADGAPLGDPRYVAADILLAIDEGV